MLWKTVLFYVNFTPLAIIVPVVLVILALAAVALFAWRRHKKAEVELPMSNVEMVESPPKHELKGVVRGKLLGICSCFRN